MAAASRAAELARLAEASDAQVAWAERFAARHRALAGRLAGATPVGAEEVVGLLDEAVAGLARQASLLAVQGDLACGAQRELDGLRAALRELVAAGLADAVRRERRGRLAGAGATAA